MTGFGSPCGACKFLRRKCLRGCVFAPYFCHEQGATHFAAIHKVFGASNVSKLLTHLPLGDRCEAAVTISYEAQARIQDPVYGCVAHIFALQQQVVSLQEQLTTLRAQQAAQGFVNGGNITTSTNDHIHQQDNHNKLFYGDFPTTYPQDIEALNMQLNESKILSEQLYQNNTSMNDSNSTATTDDENMFYHENGVVNMENSPSNQMTQEYHDRDSFTPPEETVHQFMTGATFDEQHYSSDEHQQHAAMASLYLEDMQMNAEKWTFQDTNQDDLQSMAFAYFQRS
ncbi:hypothetical protein MKW98_012885 [Papaver atlanticum]|uniref:LOB domain-containing protein n=1 Tax=Papaver atlanticum TaxID=357466 RepID=A0AAD4XFS3_9MAGN|nr:hypothetical protein MKW98_012885 [Papaver atlanticum]